jgi:RHH-type proline utilization regulon transcriptional repressor/proline dehydrogenase/delta 1-pyrroline-5-carboxylate dehydrogenase
LDISYSKDATPIPNIEFWHKTIAGPKWIEENEQSYLQRVSQGHYKKIRFLSKPTEALIRAAAENATAILSNPVLANGRFELLYFLREISFSIDYHRYGNLGLREGEKRTPIL